MDIKLGASIGLNETIHVFEEAGLGKGPFKLHHVTAEGGRCEYCNTVIVFRFYIQGKDSRIFFVGSDCVMKTGDLGLIKVVEKEVKKRQAELREKRDEAKLQELKDFIKNPDNIKKLNEQPHPNAYFANQGKTQKDYLEYMIKYACKTTKLKLAKKLLPKDKQDTI